MELMIVTAAEPDASQIVDITARAGVFNQEEVECVREIFEEYLTLGPEGSGYTLSWTDGEQVLASPATALAS
jgi:hypothetical protein